jgi:hypothetical protein
MGRYRGGLESRVESNWLRSFGRVELCRLLDRVDLGGCNCQGDSRARATDRVRW